MGNDFGSIQINSKFKIQRLLFVEVVIFPGEHARAEITAVLEEAGENALYQTEDDQIEIKEKDKLLFCGIPGKISLHQDGGSTILILQAYSETLRLDLKKKSRSFQNEKQTYGKLFEEVIKAEYGGQFLAEKIEGEKQGKVFIQYEETDWEFLKRVAAEEGAVLIPDDKGRKPQIYIGIPELGSKKEENAYLYQAEKNIRRFQQIEAEEGGQKETNYVVYELESNREYDIGMETIYQGTTLCVAGKRIFGQLGEVKRCYYLMKKDGCQSGRKKNERGIGLGLKGKVIEIEKDKVKLHLAIDKNQPKESAHWFSFGTPYTGGEGPGLYVMPQEGDEAMLYLPESDEGLAYVRGISRTDGAGNPKTGQPGIKYLGIPNGKELKMGAGETSLTAKPGTMFLSLSEEGGITIESDQKIDLKSSGNINIKGKKIKITAQDEITMEAGESNVVMDNITHLKGKKIKQSGTLKR